MADTYTLISSVTVGAGGASSIDFTSIPSTYTDLVIRTSIRGSNAANYNFANITFNGSGSGYSARTLEGNGSAASSYLGSGSAITVVLGVGASSTTASTFSNGDIYIPNYAGSTNKSISVDTVNESNVTAILADLHAGLWANTAAITSISLGAVSGTWQQYSTAYLYGIKNS